MLKNVVDVILISWHPRLILCKASHLWEPFGNKAEGLHALGAHKETSNQITPFWGGSGSPWALHHLFVEINKDHLNEKCKGYQFRACSVWEFQTHHRLSFGRDPAAMWDGWALPWWKLWAQGCWRRLTRSSGSMWSARGVHLTFHNWF